MRIFGQSLFAFYLSESIQEYCAFINIQFIDNLKGQFRKFSNCPFNINVFQYYFALQAKYEVKEDFLNAYLKKNRLPILTVHFDFPAISLGYCLGNGKPDSGAACLLGTGIIRTVKAIE